MSIRRKLLDLGNAMLAPSGLQLYRRGVDMESGLRLLASRRPAIGAILDLGAARGDWSARVLNLFPGVPVLAVDPLQERDPYLGALKRRNGNFDYVIAAAGDRSRGHVELSVTKDLDGSTVGGVEGARRRVDVVAVDDLVAARGLSGPFFLKFDTHGFEVPIMQGAEAALRQTSYVVMEAYNFRHTDKTVLFHEMIGLMESRGFRVFNLVDVLQRFHDGLLWQMDLFFARKEDPMFRSDRFRNG
jgi:FkbM family methyltransferase